MKRDLRRIKKARAVAAWLWDEASRTLQLRNSHGVENKDAVGMPIQIGEGANGWVASYRRTCAVPNVQHPPEGVTYRPGHEWTRGELVVPLVSGDMYFGNLDLGFPEANSFDEDDVDLIEGIANQVAAALSRSEIARAQQKAEQRVREADIMSSIGQSAFELVHRLGNELGLVSSYANFIRRASSRISRTLVNHRWVPDQHHSRCRARFGVITEIEARTSEVP